MKKLEESIPFLNNGGNSNFEEGRMKLSSHNEVQNLIEERICSSG